MIWKITNALGQEVIWYNEDEINKILYKNCPCRYQYNVFGVPDKDCCYKYHKYCDEITDCFIKEFLGKLALKEQECEELKETVDGLLKIQYQLADSCNKYVQTLTEIKEIAESKSLYGATCQDMKLILQKISECETENE